MYRIRDKKERNRKLMQELKDKPDLTCDELGIMFGITRQRVSQIIKRERK